MASTVSRLSNTGTGTFAAAVDLAAPLNPHAISIGDLDGDGAPEIVIAAHGADAIGVFDNTGGAIASPVTFPVGDGPEDSIAMAGST